MIKYGKRHKNLVNRFFIKVPDAELAAARHQGRLKECCNGGPIGAEAAGDRRSRLLAL